MERGFTAFFVTILVLTVVFGIGVSIFSLTYGEQKMINGAVRSSQAYYGAEAGIEDAILRIKNSMNLPGNYLIAVEGVQTQVSVQSPNASTRIITANAGKTGVFRKLESQLTIETVNPEFFYGAQVGDGGIELENLSAIEGNVFSGGSIEAEPGTEITGAVQISGAGNKIDGAVIRGNAYANICNNSDVGGILYSASQTGCAFSSFVATSSFPSSVPLPISAQDIADWKAEAEAGGVINGNQSFSSGSNPLGPIKIAGNLTVQNDAEIIVNGTVWVTGNIIVKNNARVRLSSSYGYMSGVIVANSTIRLENNSVSSGSGQSSSYLMYLSDSALDPALTIKNNAIADVLYTSSGWLQVENNTSLKEATGYGLRLKSNARIIYALGLQNAFFTSGPGGAWEVASWKETQ